MTRQRLLKKTYQSGGSSLRFIFSGFAVCFISNRRAACVCSGTVWKASVCLNTLQLHRPASDVALPRLLDKPLKRHLKLCLAHLLKPRAFGKQNRGLESLAGNDKINSRSVVL